MKQLTDRKTIMHIVDYERIDGVLHIAGITRSVGQGLDFKNGYVKIPVVKTALSVPFAEILALNELMRWSGCKSFRLTRAWNCKITPFGVISFYSLCIIVLIQHPNVAHTRNAKDCACVSNAQNCTSAKRACVLQD